MTSSAILDPINMYFDSSMISGADAGFQKRGVWVTVIKFVAFVHMHATFPPLYEVWGSPKRGGGGSCRTPKIPPPPHLDPPLKVVENVAAV